MPSPATRSLPQRTPLLTPTFLTPPQRLDARLSAGVDFLDASGGPPLPPREPTAAETALGGGGGRAMGSLAMPEFWQGERRASLDMILGDEGGNPPSAAELAASLGAMAGGDGATADAAYLAPSDSDGDDDLVRNPPTEAELAEAQQYLLGASSGNESGA